MTLLSVATVLAVGLLLLITTKEIALDSAVQDADATTAFPVGVDPEQKVIVENSAVDSFFDAHVVATSKRNDTNWLRYTLAKLTQFDWYQNLASPTGRILVIQPGERKEQVSVHFSKILKWNTTETQEFVTLVANTLPSLSDGKFYPGNYVASKDSSPEEIANMIVERFKKEVLSRYSNEVASKVTLADALIIASILEREAYDFTDMREISGVIWNRLFIDMNLQIDATLQYAKGTDSPTTWWPIPRPRDKYIDSPFNTYQNQGLPPSPIANPTSESILAALNPKKTECLFYFHDSQSQFHCSPTYEGHVALLKEYYGRGR